jgi:hypothetical protein
VMLYLGDYLSGFVLASLQSTSVFLPTGFCLTS